MTKDASEVVNDLLGEKIKCTLDDGRTATGTFICLDRLKNLILTNVTEERWVNTSDYSEVTNDRILTTRKLSQAMVPGVRLVKIEVEANLHASHIAPHLK